MAFLIQFLILASIVFLANAFTPRMKLILRSQTSVKATYINLPQESMQTNQTFPSESIYVSASLDPKRRFDRTADTIEEADTECILTIDGARYNLTAWAKAHPGGLEVLQRFNGKDASKAFHATAHSKKAYEMLAQFAIDEVPLSKDISKTIATVPRWRRKLFTKEDPNGVHKYLGLFVLLNFIFRFGQMFFGDPSAGLGTRMGKGPGVVSGLCLVPHAMLSMSSLIFHIPRQRVKKSPMIWQEVSYVLFYLF